MGVDSDWRGTDSLPHFVADCLGIIFFMHIFLCFLLLIIPEIFEARLMLGSAQRKMVCVRLVCVCVCARACVSG